MFFRIILIIILSLTSFSGIFAACNNEGDITKSNFKLDLGCMDPLGEADKIQGQGGLSVLKTLLTSVSEALLFIIPIIAAVSLLVAGYFYIFSAGDSEKVGRAKTIIKWNIIAILVAFLSYGIIRLVASFFA